MLFYILLGVGLALAVEGLAYTAAPNAMKRMMAVVIDSPAGALRLVGLFSLAAGVILVALARQFAGT